MPDPVLFASTLPPPPSPLGRGLVIDNFAGGGGASTGIEAALGRPIDIAINHDPQAVAMHAANHPATVHYCQSVWRADPVEVTGGRPVDLAWFSPDCKHFSKAKGGKPVERNIRDLAWVVVLWARRVRPAVIMLENVEEFRTWGPIGADGMPIAVSRGAIFEQWLRELRRAGYKVEHRELRACDYGAPTSRRRLFVIARCDGRPIVWPKPTHAKGGAGGLLPWRTAADIIDWSIPCPSIFERQRPLAEATLKRIAHGVMRYVVNAATPFVVPLTHHGGASRVIDVAEPLPTVTAAHRGEMAVVAPLITPICHTQGGNRTNAATDPVVTITTAKGGELALTAAFLSNQRTSNTNGGRADPNLPMKTLTTGHDAREPVSTIVGKGCTQRLVSSHLVKLRGTCADGQPVDVPVPTLTAGGGHIGEVRSFLIKYYGASEHGQAADRPIDAVTAKARFGLVTVAGEVYEIADIGMRMLTPRELFRAQGFPDSYVIDPVVGGKPMTKTSQIARCGNSVCPPLAEALVRANCLPAELAVAA